MGRIREKIKMRDLGNVGEAKKYHTPVLLKEAIEGLNVRQGKRYIDATLGGGGHSLEILKLGGEVLGIDCDQEAIEYSKKQFSIFNDQFSIKLVRGNFRDLRKIAEENGFEKVAGILFDLGVSSHQLETDSRGFSFNSNAAIDMRMDSDLKVTAADLVNGLNEGELDELFNKYGKEHYSRAIARAIVRARTLKPIKTGKELAEIAGDVRGLRNIKGKLHPATRIFQALRIAVNDELNNLKTALPQAAGLLEKNGRLVVISFHSLEDRIVKIFFKEEEKKGILKIRTLKPMAPSLLEIKDNPRSRSAKLRIAENE